MNNQTSSKSKAPLCKDTAKKTKREVPGEEKMSANH